MNVIWAGKFAYGNLPVSRLVALFLVTTHDYPRCELLYAPKQLEHYHSPDNLSGDEWRLSDKEVRKIDLQKAASPEEADELEEMTAKEMAVDGYHVVTRSRGGPATGRCGGHTQVSRQAKHYAHKGINALSCDKAFQNPCHSAKREQKYVQQHIRICTHGVKTGLG